MDFAPILDKIIPTKKEERELADAVRYIIRKIKIPGVRSVLGGSGAKHTWLRHTHDLDIYVCFSPQRYGTRSGELAEILFLALRKKFRGVKRLHGSRDYFHLHHNGYTFELVPIFDIRKAEEAQNITDFSQLHVQYVLKHVNRRKQLGNEIRLSKQFAKANHVYGAESYIKGFSGYVLELLTIHYGSFMNFVRAASRWKAETVIGDKKVVKRLNPSKLSPLIVIDPVQPDRNAAAAISESKYYDFILACRAFLRHPSPSFFEEKHLDPLKLGKLGTLVTCDVKPLQGNRDLVGAKLLKAFTYIKNQMKHHDFTVLGAKWTYNPVTKKTFFYYIIDKTKLPEMKKHPGPAVEHTQALQQFRKHHKNVIVEGKRSYAIEKRKHITLRSLLREVLGSVNVKKRVASIRVLSS